MYLSAWIFPKPTTPEPNISSLLKPLPRHQIPTRRHKLQHDNIRISPGETTFLAGPSVLIQQLPQLCQQHPQQKYLANGRRSMNEDKQ